MKYIIKNARVIDPPQKLDGILDVAISDGKISDIGKSLNPAGHETIDAKGRIVSPGLVDMHAHLREPGREDKETVDTGTRAAIVGGFTSITAMPNTEPAMDDPETIRLLKEIIIRDAKVNVSIVGAITHGRAGKKLTDFKSLKEEGVIAVSDDGSSVDDPALMLKALEEAKSQSLVLIDHSEDTALSSCGVINKGFIATKMGLRGIPKESEYMRVKRDLGLAKKASAKIHIAHVSCKESVDLIRKAKKAGIGVSAETCPHYISLTEECCATYDTNTKMNPPLRTGEDVDAIKEGLRDGTIDAIATDHAPHTDSEKDVEFDFAPFGIIGLETALSIAVMELIDKKILTWNELIAKMSWNPANILGLDKGSLRKGAMADLVIIDPDKEYLYSKDKIESKSKNTPFLNWRLKAKVTHVFVSGNCVMKEGSILA